MFSKLFLKVLNLEGWLDQISRQCLKKLYTYEFLSIFVRKFMEMPPLNYQSHFKPLFSLLLRHIEHGRDFMQIPQCFSTFFFPFNSSMWSNPFFSIRFTSWSSDFSLPWERTREKQNFGDLEGNCLKKAPKIYKYVLLGNCAPLHKFPVEDCRL